MAVRFLLLSTVLGACCILNGCGGSGPKLVDVHGTVTMDGKPLPKAHIVFRRQDSTGRPSFGTTDEKGDYRLGYSMTREGVLLGDFNVSISTYSEAYEGEKAVPETVPVRYNRRTELTATIEEQGQEVNFDLTSDGKIIQPYTPP